MDTKDFLVTLLNELRQISGNKEICDKKLVEINQSIIRYKFKIRVDNAVIDNSDTIEYDEDYGFSNEDSLYNRQGTNHDMDIDQQGADFDF